MDETAAVLAANQAFYDAFAGGDGAAMEQLWADRDPVACIHPGAPVIHGRDEVLDSWKQILGAPDRPMIRCRGAQAHLLGDAAFVTCYEQIGGGLLVATNLFVRRDGAWRLVHHQAGPAIAAAAGTNAPPRRLH